MTNAQTLYERALLKWGTHLQYAVAIEEMAELTQALIKDIRHKTPSNIQEEIADVMIMMEQLAIVFGKSDVAEAKAQKLERLKERLDNDK